MAKAKTAYVCRECGAHSVKWAGQCPDCASWNTLSETTISVPKPAAGPGIAATTLRALPDDIEARQASLKGIVKFRLTRPINNIPEIIKMTPLVKMAVRT